MGTFVAEDCLAGGEDLPLQHVGRLCVGGGGGDGGEISGGGVQDEEEAVARVCEVG